MAANLYGMAAKKAVQGMMKIPENRYAEIASGGGDRYHQGGKVKRTGPAMLQKGEQVLSRKTAKKYRAQHGKRHAKSRGKE